MAVIKPRLDDLFRFSLVPLSGELYDLLLDKLRLRLKGELVFIDAPQLRKAIKSYSEFRGRNGIVAVLPRNSVRLTAFVQSASLGDKGMEFEVRISLPILGTSSEHEEVWKRLLAGNFPEHVLCDGELAIIVNVPEAGILKSPSGTFGLRDKHHQAA